MIAKSEDHCPDGRFPGDPPKPSPSSYPKKKPEGRRPMKLASGADVWKPHLLRVSAIITAHNYSRFLGDAIRSVLNQSIRPFEVLVIDDSSDDHPEGVAIDFPEVRFEQVEFRNVHKTRAYGFERTSGEVVLFFDADNTIPPDFIENGLRQFDSHRVGVVYPRIMRHGRENGERVLNDSDLSAIDRINFADTASLIRRDALAYSMAFEEEIEPHDVLDDWFLMRRLHRDRWEFRKNPSFLLYRVHEENRSKLWGDIFKAPDYYKIAALDKETITILIPLSGRLSIFLEHLAPFLDRQEWPKDQVSLLLIDTSGDDRFSSELREWALRSEYEDIRIMKLKAAPETGLADDDRRAEGVERKVQDALSVIYNRAARAIDSSFLWIIEDDVIPPDNAAEELLRSFDPNVGSVSAPYDSRYDPDVVAWYHDGKRAKEPEELGVEEIHGSGFGCLMIRSELFKNHLFQVPPGENWYDPVFFKMLSPKWKRLLDWGLKADHLGAYHREDHQGGECLIR